VELGLWTCLQEDAAAAAAQVSPPGRRSVVIFGSDQGLVGRFNEVIVEFAVAELGALGGAAHVIAVGERVQSKLLDAGLSVSHLLPVPSTPRGITRFVGELLVQTLLLVEAGEFGELLLFHNQPSQGRLFAPTRRRVLPLDDAWRAELLKRGWPTKQRPEILGERELTLRGLLHEYLFVLVYRAMAESLASEHISRLAAMQRAEKNIDERLDELNMTFHRLRQSGIDEELFDVVAGFEALVR
jgi:F-type H+-transporting ATPase subunit gamma